MPPAPRITFVSIGGLQTMPGAEGFKPGACSRLKNLRFVAPNRLRGIAKYATPTQGGANGSTPVRTIHLSNNKSAVVHQTTGFEYRTYGDNVTSNIYSYPSYYPSAGQMSPTSIFPVIVRDRLLVNGMYGVLVSDFVDPDFSIAFQRTWRSAQLPQPQIQSITEAAGSTIPNNTMVTYAAVLRRIWSFDSYSLTSQPSLFVRRLNDSGAAVDNTVRVSWAYSDDIREGDIVELYRTNGIPATDYTTETGDQCFLVATKSVTASDVTNKRADLVDLQLMTSPLYETSGTEIYTSGNNTQENNPPPICSAVCTWKGFVFYGNIQEDSTIALDPKATVGTLTTPWERANGIGTRSGTGTITNGSATISLVSAADLVGIKPGQLWAGGGTFPTTARVVSAGSGNIVMNTTAVGGGAAQPFTLIDSVNIDGTDYRFGSWGALSLSLASGPFELHTLQTVPAELATQVGNTMTVRPMRHAPGASGLAVKVTNAQNYNGDLSEYASGALTGSRTPQRNLIRYSKSNQPEAVPYGNELRIGLGSIISMHSTTEYVYVNCSDGVYRITGTEGNFRVDTIDQNLVVAGPMAASAMQEQVYALSNRGFVVYDASGVQPISRGILDDLIPQLAYRDSLSPTVQCDTSNEEVWMLYHGATAASESTIYVYSPRYQGFTEVDLVGTDAYVKTLGTTKGTTTELPTIAVAMYTSGAAAPKYSTFNGTGAPLPLEVFLREAGDAMTVKQWIDFSVVVDLASANETVRSTVNQPLSPIGTGTTVAGRVDSRVNFGIPRADAVRPQLAAGFLVEAPTRIIDVLGMSFRVVPKSTQQVSR